MSKQHLNLSIEGPLVQRARDKGLNFSGILEDSLRAVLATYEHTQDPENCKHKWTWAFCVPTGLAKECLKCGTYKKVYIEKEKNGDTRNKTNVKTNTE